MSAAKDKPQFANSLNLQDMAAKGMAHAKQVLQSRGIEYPLYNPRLSVEENYRLTREYSEMEADLIVQYVRAPSGPRPLVLDNVQPMSNAKRWESYND